MPQSLEPPDGLPVYRLLTGPDDAAFCERVSDALSMGYRLYGEPILVVAEGKVIAGQAVLWPSRAEQRTGEQLP